jgi:hypothetical protein
MRRAVIKLLTLKFKTKVQMKNESSKQAPKKALRKTDVRRYIDEYIGKHFRFLENYIYGGYEEYVRDNLKKITHKKVFGKETIRKEYKNIHSPFLLEQQVLEDCEKTLEYVRLYCA